MKIRSLVTTSTLLAISTLATLPVSAQPADDVDTSLSFFITSAGPGDGANLGGLAGADAHCAALATAAGSNGKTWHAYLSTNGSGSVDARDRIGAGPWYNADGALVARSVTDLHFSNVNLNKQVSLTETGTIVNGRGDTPNQHDILTGTNPDGTAAEGTCNNWTSNAENGNATVGHFDRTGGGDLAESWNAAHQSRGCGQDNLIATGGNGYFYCFAE